MDSNAPLAAERIREMWEEEDDEGSDDEDEDEDEDELEEVLEEWNGTISARRNQLLYLQVFMLVLVLLWFLSMVVVVFYS
jgi:uncharacterized protein (UPF0305 family)